MRPLARPRSRCAPTATLTQTLFKFLLAQLVAPGAGLAHDGPLHRDAVYVLESLSTVKSVVLVCDVPAATELVTAFFEQLLRLAESPLATNVELAITDVLTQLVEECVSLPPRAVDALMDAFASPPASARARIAADVCRATQDRLQKHAAHYFSAALAAAADEEEDERSAALAALHAQLVRVAEAVPSLLTSVVPQLEVELAAQDAGVRHFATRVLGALFADGAAHLAELHPSTWRAWLGRAVDRVAALRADWVDGALRVLSSYAALGDALAPGLCACVGDPDERVRAAVGRAVGALSLEALRHVPEALLRELAQRGKDRRAGVRDSALGALGRAFDLAYADVALGDAPSVARYGWIPGAVLRCHLAGTPGVVRSVVAALEAHVFPMADAAAFATRLAVIARLLDDDALAVLLHVSNLRLARPSVYDVYLACCRDAGDERLAPCVRALAAALHDPAAVAPLSAFAAQPDDEVLRAMATCFDAATPLAESAAARAAGAARARTVAPEAADALAACLWNGGFPIVNQACVLALVDTGVARVLVPAAELAPVLLVPHAAALLARAAESALALRLAAAAAAYDAAALRIEAAARDMLVVRATSGTRAARDATQVLACGARGALGDVLRALQAQVETGAPAACAAALEALAAAQHHAPDAFRAADTLVDHVLHHVLLAPWRAGDVSWSAVGVAESEAEDDATTALRMRTAALAVVTHWCLAQSDAALAPPVLKLLWVVLAAGEPQGAQHTPAAARAALRLCAAQRLLELAGCAAYAPLIAARMPRLAYALQDEAFAVRSALLHTLLVRLASDKLPPSFHALLFLVAFDPEDEMRAHVAAYVRRTQALPAAVRDACLVDVFPRFLYLLAHHPDLVPDVPQELAAFARYVDFFLACVATPDNVGALAGAAHALRTAVDVTADARDASHRLHVVGELAQVVSQRHADAHGWRIGTTEPPPLPADLVRAAPGDAPRVLSDRVVELLQDTRARRVRDKRARRA